MYCWRSYCISTSKALWTRHRTSHPCPVSKVPPPPPASSANEAGALWLQHCAPPPPPPRGKGPPQHPTKHPSLSQAQVGAPHRHWSGVHGVTPSCTFFPEPHSLIQKCHNQAQENASAGNLNAEHCVACFRGLTAFGYTMVHFFLRAERVGENAPLRLPKSTARELHDSAVSASTQSISATSSTLFLTLKNYLCWKQWRDKKWEICLFLWHRTCGTICYQFAKPFPHQSKTVVASLENITDALQSSFLTSSLLQSLSPQSLPLWA